MSACDVVRDKLEDRGMTIAELSRRSGVDYEKVRDSLVEDRKMLADELVSLCRVLGIEMFELYE